MVPNLSVLQTGWAPPLPISIRIAHKPLHLLVELSLMYATTSAASKERTDHAKSVTPIPESSATDDLRKSLKTPHAIQRSYQLFVPVFYGMSYHRLLTNRVPVSFFTSQRSPTPQAPRFPQTRHASLYPRFYLRSFTFRTTCGFGFVFFPLKLRSSGFRNVLESSCKFPGSVSKNSSCTFSRSKSIRRSKSS